MISTLTASQFHCQNLFKTKFNNETIHGKLLQSGMPSASMKSSQGLQGVQANTHLELFSLLKRS